MIRRARVIVRGIVQGVNYRYSTKLKADELDLAGTVRNLPDGSVEIVCEGDEGQVGKMIEWSRQGPRAAIVTGIDLEWQEDPAGFTDFAIVYR